MKVLKGSSTNEGMFLWFCSRFAFYRSDDVWKSDLISLTDFVRLIICLLTFLRISLYWVSLHYFFGQVLTIDSKDASPGPYSYFEASVLGFKWLSGTNLDVEAKLVGREHKVHIDVNFAWTFHIFGTTLKDYPRIHVCLRRYVKFSGNDLV